jgi:hypothetical protein
MIKQIQISHSKLTPLRAIRSKCIDCSGHELNEVRNCQADDCPLFSLRMGRGNRKTFRAIRSYCLWCCGQRDEVRQCPSVKCSLWEFRFGKRLVISILNSKNRATEEEVGTKIGLWDWD